MRKRSCRTSSGFFAEHLFGEIVEDVAFGLPKNFDEVGASAPFPPFAARQRLRCATCRTIAAADPPVRALPDIRQLLCRQF